MGREGIAVLTIVAAAFTIMFGGMYLGYQYWGWYGVAAVWAGILLVCGCIIYLLLGAITDTIDSDDAMRYEDE